MLASATDSTNASKRIGNAAASASHGAAARERMKSLGKLLLAGVSLAVLLACFWLGRESALRPEQPARKSVAAPAAAFVPKLDFHDKNLILISIDTLRADRLSVYGYQRPTSPYLEDFARQGVVFDNFFHSGGGTLESHMSMLTSLHPLTHGVTPASGLGLELERVTLAEQLKAAGYSTAAFVDDGYLEKKYGFDQGFDIYDDRGGRFAAILPRAQQWLERHRNAKFLLFLHTYDVHSEFNRMPYECPGDYPRRHLRQTTVAFDGCRRGRCASDLLAWVNQGVRDGELSVDEVFSQQEIDFISSLYDGCINYVDARLADLFGLLQSLHLFQDSLIVVTSDHGEEFGEHGLLIHDNTSYEELAHIPLLIRLPGAALAGRRVPHLSAMVDLMPTLLELLGLPVPAQAQGRSLLPAITDGRVVRESLHIYTNLRTLEWKFLAEPQELYDLVADPREQRNLYAARPEQVRQLDRIAQELARADQRDRAEFTRRVPPREVVLDEDERQRLRALGYVRN